MNSDSLVFKKHTTLSEFFTCRRISDTIHSAWIYNFWCDSFHVDICITDHTYSYIYAHPVSSASPHDTAWAYMYVPLPSRYSRFSTRTLCLRMRWEAFRNSDILWHARVVCNGEERDTNIYIHISCVYICVYMHTYVYICIHLTLSHRMHATECLTYFILYLYTHCVYEHSGIIYREHV